MRVPPACEWLTACLLLHTRLSTVSPNPALHPQTRLHVPQPSTLSLSLSPPLLLWAIIYLQFAKSPLLTGVQERRWLCARTNL